MNTARKLTVLALALIAVSLTGALAQSTEEKPLSTKDMAPLQQKRGVKARRFYPPRAEKLDVFGKAAAVCTISATGELTDCRVVAEQPLGCGFGDSILALAATLVAPAKTNDGQDTAGRQLSFPMQFRTGSGTPRHASCD